MVDYTKWNDVDDDDDDDGKPRQAAVSAASMDDRRANHEQSLSLIAGWVREACPHLVDDDVAQLMHFLSVQHPGIHEHNIMRHQGITAFLEAAEAAGKAPTPRSLFALGHLAKERSEAADRDMASRGERVLVVAMHALNTLVACRSEGGARKLFATLLGDPAGQVAVRYKALEFATDYVRSPPPEPVVGLAPSTEPELTWLQKLGRIFLQQLSMAVITAVVVKCFLMPDFDVLGLTPAPQEEQVGAAHETDSQ